MTNAQDAIQAIVPSASEASHYLHALIVRGVLDPDDDDVAELSRAVTHIKKVAKGASTAFPFPTSS